MTSPSPSEPRTPSQSYHAALRPAAAAKLAVLATVALYGSQILLVAFRTLDMVAAAVSLLLTAAVLVWRVRKLGGVAVLGVRAPQGRFVLAAVLIGLSAWYIDALLVDLVQPPGDTELLQHVVEQSPLLPTLAAIAVCPAIAEELLFRGLLARSLATRSALFGVLVSSVVFSLYHIDPPQIVGTFPLALALGLLAVRSDSVVPGMIAHFLNNAIAVVIAREELPAVDDTLSAHPGTTLGVALALTGTGVVLAARRAR